MQYVLVLILLFLYSTNSLGACPAFYGKQNANGSWSFSDQRETGMLEVEVDSNCAPVPGAYRLVGGKYIIDTDLQTAKLTEIAKEREANDWKKQMAALQLRVEALEKKTKDK